MMTPKVDYLAIIRRTVRIALRESTLGRYDRTYRRPHRRQACYGEFIMPSFYQPRPRPGFLIDTSSSMQNAQLSRAVTELGGAHPPARICQRGRRGVLRCRRPRREEAVQRCAIADATAAAAPIYRKGLDWFVHKKSGPIDLLIMVTDCETAWPDQAPPFPVITIRVGDGLPPPWGDRGANKVITIEDRDAQIARSIATRKKRWPAER